MLSQRKTPRKVRTFRGVAVSEITVRGIAGEQMPHGVELLAVRGSLVEEAIRTLAGVVRILDHSRHLVGTRIGEVLRSFVRETVPFGGNAAPHATMRIAVVGRTIAAVRLLPSAVRLMTDRANPRRKVARTVLRLSSILGLSTILRLRTVLMRRVEGLLGLGVAVPGLSANDRVTSSITDGAEQGDGEPRQNRVFQHDSPTSRLDCTVENGEQHSGPVREWKPESGDTPAGQFRLDGPLPGSPTVPAGYIGKSAGQVA